MLAHLRAIPPRPIAAAMLCTAVSYWLLGFYDVLALRYLGKPLPYARTLFTSFIAYSFGHNFGIAAFTGGAVRYRLYSARRAERRRCRDRRRLLRRDHGHRPGCAGRRVVRIRAAPGALNPLHIEPNIVLALGVCCCWR